MAFASAELPWPCNPLQFWREAFCGKLKTPEEAVEPEELPESDQDGDDEQEPDEDKGSNVLSCLLTA